MDKASSRTRHFGPLCRGPRPGDCDPVSCGGTCESRYISGFVLSTFHQTNADKVSQIRSASNHQLRRRRRAGEKICSIIGMHPHARCRSYSTLPSVAQRLIRIWSMDVKDRRRRFSNDILKRISDRRRHHQLINGNSRFCCRSIAPEKTLTMKFHANATGKRSIIAVLSIIIILTSLLLR
ncbi:hypothetical protein DICVIV_12353 [Dictyocaulus viviparus]|uniref:Uncharacterized protein n=1 Tax=Dictyocaulus viviparus TaxID=29172 RepID=A0A0D8XDG5_DICVI|nr:hypothetical protein DICVIV_12353 [Dictyocaulus viviparus]